MPAEEPVNQQRLGWKFLLLLLFAILAFGLVVPFVKSAAGRAELTNTYLAVSVGFACLCTLLGAGIAFLSRGRPFIFRLLILFSVMMALLFLSMGAEQELGYRLDDTSNILLLMAFALVEELGAPSDDRRC